MSSTVAVPAFPTRIAGEMQPEATQQADPDSDPLEPSDEPDIIVRGSRNLPGSVFGDIPAEKQICAAEIRSMASARSRPCYELAPLTGSGRGGCAGRSAQRQAHLGLLRNPQHPDRGDSAGRFLPEKVALKYGYRADRKVVNVVLRRRFNATTVEAADRVATAGGRVTLQEELDLLTIRRGGRSNSILPCLTGREVNFHIVYENVIIR